MFIDYGFLITTTALISYLGHSEKDTGNWCFKDGTISFQEIFNLYRKHCTNKLLSISSDCSYSGQWVREGAKTLDSLGIPPCGHRARKNGALIKVFASCQPDQEAAEPCYSIEGVTVKDDGSIKNYAKQLSRQRSMWFDSTRLVCCRGPDSPCPQSIFEHLKWEDGVENTMSVHRIERKKGTRDKWYYILLHRAGEAYQKEFHSQLAKDANLRLSDWGYILESGEGKNIPDTVENKVNNGTTVASV